MSPQYVFMDLETFEETRLQRDDSWARYKKEGSNVEVGGWNDKVAAPLCLQSHEAFCLQLYQLSAAITRLIFWNFVCGQKDV